MMQLLPILIVVSAHLSREAVLFTRVDPFGLSGWRSAVITLGAMLAVVIWHAAVVGLCARRLNRSGGLGYLIMADRAGAMAPWLIVAVHVTATFVGGWRQTVEGWLGGPVVFVVTLLTILPVLIALTFVWFNHYPIARRARDAVMLRAIDEGRPITAVLSRRSYLLLQVRLNLLFLLVPLLFIVAWSETVDAVWPWEPSDLEGWSPMLQEITAIAGAFTIFLFAPLMARATLELERLRDGPMREMLLRVCSRHKVKVSGVLVWRTGGNMINGAVMGLIAPVRYVMLTDALLERMPAEYVEAVMAHEIGHVRRHHMPWLIAALFAALSLPMLLLELAFRIADRSAVNIPNSAALMIEYTSLAAAIAAAVFIFGWISRQFERQADSFSVQHLSGLRADQKSGERQPIPESITESAANTMYGALESVARLNGLDPDKRSWRHGSVRSRQKYLRSLIGSAVRSLPIDRNVARIKLATAAVILAVVAAAVFDAVA